MTIKLLDRTTPQIVREAKLAGAVAGKLYPAGVTTNSDDGVRYIQSLYDTFEVMQEVGMVLSLHGEAPEAFCLDREEAFLGILKDIAKTFPRLRIVLEHVTTNAAVETVQALPETVAATITAHHLVLTLDDVVGGKINPHNFCKPLAKRPADRSALIEAAFSYSPKFFFGTDSAPHIRETKECAAGCAGCFTAPLALELLAHVADEHGLSLEGIQGFTSEYGAQFYGLPLNEGMVTFVREPWTVPDVLDGVVPFWAGQTLNWRCKFLHGGPFYSA
jgi:dihydroorotase